MAYDIFFLSYEEPNADENWQKLSSRFPTAKRVTGVKGILTAHQACAKRSFTSHFYVVDADSEVLETFDFSFRVAPDQSEYVHLWYARNPTNALEYGWGGLKLFPKKKVLGASSMGTDMTMSFPLVIHPEVASITHFNSSPYDTWRSAFREAAKLTRALPNEEAASRLQTWMTVAGDAPYAEWAIKGALDGHEFAKVYLELAPINDWSWLSAEYRKRYE